MAALNIQRGRDHGLPGYSEYKHFCSKDLLKKSVNLRSRINSPPVDSFEDLYDTIDQDIIAKLKEVYADVKDVDLFTGGQRYKLLSSPNISESLQVISKGLFKVFICTKKRSKIFLYFCPSL